MLEQVSQRRGKEGDRRGVDCLAVAAVAPAHWRGAVGHSEQHERELDERRGEIERLLPVKPRCYHRRGGKQGKRGKQQPLAVGGRFFLKC